MFSMRMHFREKVGTTIYNVMNIILFLTLPFKKHNNFIFPSKILKNIKKHLKFITLLAKRREKFVVHKPESKNMKYKVD